jgi:probable rRNA maturation factor
VALLFLLEHALRARITRRSSQGKNIVIILQKSVPGLSQAALSKFVRRARGAIQLRGAVNVLVTSSREMRTLNRSFRGKHQPTDVLSFPPARGLVNFAGDIAISAEIAAQNARRLGHSAVEEVEILALHGLLHLAGYDHERDSGEMARKEQRLRRILRLPVGLMERSGNGQGLNPKGAKRKPRARCPDC